MCLVCIEIQKGQLTPNEFAAKIGAALKEDPSHEEELINALGKADPKYLDQLEEFLYENLERQLIDILIVR